MRPEESERAYAIKIYRSLPGKDCGEKSPCGLPRCRMFALKLLRDEKSSDNCPYMTDAQRQAVALIMDEYYR